MIGARTTYGYSAVDLWFGNFGERMVVRHSLGLWSWMAVVEASASEMVSRKGRYRYH